MRDPVSGGSLDSLQADWMSQQARPFPEGGFFLGDLEPFHPDHQKGRGDKWNCLSHPWWRAIDLVLAPCAKRLASCPFSRAA